MYATEHLLSFDFIVQRKTYTRKIFFSSHECKLH
jgi:hypothetical protein